MKNTDKGLEVEIEGKNYLLENGVFEHAINGFYTKARLGDNIYLLWFNDRDQGNITGIYDLPSTSMDN